MFFFGLHVQNYYEKMEKRQEREQDSSKKEHTTKLITPQVAKVEHSYRPGRSQKRAAATVFTELQGPCGDSLCVRPQFSSPAPWAS